MWHTGQFISIRAKLGQQHPQDNRAHFPPQILASEAPAIRSAIPWGTGSREPTGLGKDTPGRL